MRLTYLLAFLCLMTFNTQVIGQSKFKSRSNTQSSEIIQKLRYAETIFDDSIAKALKIVETNLFIAIEKNYAPEEALAYVVLGRFNKKLTNYGLAASNDQKAINIYKRLKSNQELINLYLHLGECEIKLQENSRALTAFQSAYSTARIVQNRTLEMRIALKLGNLYLQESNLKESEKYFELSLKGAKKIKLKADIINAYIGLGNLEEKRGKPKAAEVYFLKAKQLAEGSKSVDLTNSSYNSLSNLYQNQNEIDQSIAVQQKAYDYNSTIGNTKATLEQSSNLANSYIEIGETQDAIEVLNESVPLLSKEDNTDIKRNFYKTMSEAYEQKGETIKAKAFNAEYTTLLDSFYLIEAQKKDLIVAKNELISFTQNRILLLEKDREINEKTIDFLRKEQEFKNETISKQKTITYILILGLIIILVMAFFIYRNNKAKQMSNQLLTLKSLRNQMNPHFIFNSLNSVNSFIAQKDERSANKYLSEFSKLMREVLEYSQNDFIPLAKEIEIIKLYLNLEHYRFKDNFDFTFELDPNLDIEGYQIPPMLLQPFIENAIWHGLRYKETKGELKISMTANNEFVDILICDNGIGRTKSEAVKTSNQKKMKSTGIKNVENRLEIIKKVFKKNLEISIDDQDEILKTGTKVRIKLYA